MKVLAVSLLFCLCTVFVLGQSPKQLVAPVRHFDDQRVQEFYDHLAAEFPVVLKQGKKCFFVKDARLGDDLYLDVNDDINWWSVQYYRRRYGIPVTSRQPLSVVDAHPQRPSRPTTALEIYHYMMSAFPLHEADELRYEQALPGGAVMYSPYSVTEEQAKARIQGYYNHPFPGMSRKELGMLVGLLSPPSSAEMASVVPSSAGREGNIPAYSVRVTVKGIPDTATMFVSPSGTENLPEIEPETASLAGERRFKVELTENGTKWTTMADGAMHPKSGSKHE